MIFKVLYQELPNEVPVRERTKSLYIEADSEREVRQKLVNGNYGINVEFIQALDEVHLEFEKQSDNFVLENV
jgi:DNA-dependent RNA polymerase auxiliary subunit epsilon